MLRYASAVAAMFAAASVSAQQPAGSPQPGSPQRPAQTTQINGADQNRSPNPGRPIPPGSVPNAPRSDVPLQDGQRREATGEQRAKAGDRFDAHIADCLILGNQEEVALLKFGMDRTKNNDVKQAAQSMIKDHEEAIGKLQQFASPENAHSELSAGRTGNRDVVTRESRKVPAAEGSSAHGDMFARMHHVMRVAHEQCLVLNREELTKYEGHEFDQAFLGQQLGAHIGMLAQLKAVQEEASADLSKLTAAMQETTKKHREHLEKLMNESAKEAHSKK